MFKKFTKEDIAGNAPLKSSVQRQVRAKLLEQLPFLSLPAVLPAPSPSSATGAAAATADSDDDEPRKKGLGKKDKGGGKRDKGGKGGKGGKKGRGGGAQEEEQEEVAPQPGAEGEQGGEEEGLTVLDVLWPKKETLTLVKCRDHISMYTVHGEPLFFQHFDGPFYPTLKILHRYPDMLPRVGVDRGAIKFVLSGANIMCPGITSPTGFLPPSSQNVPKGSPVAVFAYGKEHPLAIGLLAMSTDEIREVNKNVGVENVTYLGDDLWKVERI
ncbi:hypothetical protein JCM8547_002668 [Rhodosporidiobolus lusitaniae]